MDSQALIKKYNTLLKKQKESEDRLIELRTQYKVANDDLASLLEQLKLDFNVETLEDAKELLEQYKIDLEMELGTLEKNVNALCDI